MSEEIIKPLAGWVPSFGHSESIASMPSNSQTKNTLGKLELTITDEKIKELMDETYNLTTKPVEDNRCILCFLDHKEKHHHYTIVKIQHSDHVFLPVCVEHKEENDTVNAYCWGAERTAWDKFLEKAANVTK